jgi:hypothetical protein
MRVSCRSAYHGLSGVLGHRSVFAEVGMTERFKDWDERLTTARRLTGVGSHRSFERWGWPTSLLSGPWHLSRRLGNNLARPFGKRKMRRWSLTAPKTLRLRSISGSGGR